SRRRASSPRLPYTTLFRSALTSFARRLRGLRVLAVYGGAPFLPQKRALDAGAQVVVGTPGRVIDHLDRGTLTLGAVRFLVLDERSEEHTSELQSRENLVCR